MKVFLTPPDMRSLQRSGHRPVMLVHTPDRLPPIPVMDTDEFTQWMQDHGVQPAEAGMVVMATSHRP